MTTVIVIGVIAVIMLVAAIIFVRVTRTPSEESPKRRELKTAKLRAVNAQRAMHDVESILNRYRPVYADVDSALADELTNRITQYKTENLELDK